MRYLFLALALAGCYPLYRAWWANRRTSLAHAVCWAGAAWVAWGLALVIGPGHEAGIDPWRYLALCATGAAGVAVLGARRPGVAAWNFVVLGLLAVMLLPLGENLLLGTSSGTFPRLVFLAATLAVGIVNHLPTRLMLPALLLGGICACECFSLFTAQAVLAPAVLATLHVLLLLVPWLALVAWAWPFRASELHAPAEAGCEVVGKSALDSMWLDFRDRFGLLWAQRVREQYNRAAEQARLPGFLFWHGWESRGKDLLPTEGHWTEMQDLMRAVLKRFEDD